MYFPLVGERVWVNGCRDEFIVVRTDCSSAKAALALATDRAEVREGVSFRLLFAYEEFAAAQAGVTDSRQVLAVVRTTHACSYQSQAHIVEGREMLRTTLAMIEKSHALISESDRAIARWQRLNCKADGMGL